MARWVAELKNQSAFWPATTIVDTSCSTPVARPKSPCPMMSPSLASTTTRYYATCRSAADAASTVTRPEIGYSAAALLDKMMAGEADAKRHAFSWNPQASCCVGRPTLWQSTTEKWRAAMRFIREHACDGINVDDVLDRTSAFEEYPGSKIYQILDFHPATRSCD